MEKEVVLTGLRSNSEFHLGNYLGAILPMVELQKKHAGQYQLNMFVPDLHSFTTPIDHGSLYEQSLQNLKAFVAAGLDMEDQDTFIYRQSYIPAHSELTWILDCFSYFGELSRMTEFKEKVGKASLKTHVKEIHELGDELSRVPDELAPDWEEYEKEVWKLFEKIEGLRNKSVGVGLFNYPVLMASDILLYGAKYVPVGDDQRQHVEFTRNLAMRLNNKFGELFVVPEDNTKQMEFAGRTEPVRIRSLRNPEKKMSKSIEDPAGTILLSDNPDEAAQKVMSATTDSIGSVHYDFDKQPGISNLLQILALLSGRAQDDVNSEREGKDSYGELKKTVAEEVRSFLSNLQSKVSEVDEKELMEKLSQDEAAMEKVANATLLKVQQAVGLRPKS